MNIRYRVELSQAEREQLNAMLTGGKAAVCKIQARSDRACAADAGARDEDIAAHVGVGDSTVYRTQATICAGQRRSGAERRAATRGRAQALGQGRCTAGGDGLRPAAARACTLDAGVTESKDC